MEAAAAMKKEKPHAVCLPFPAQGHIIPMLKLAKLLHHKGFHITFVHTHYNYNRLLISSPNSLKGSPGFHFETISDGLPPPENVDDPQNTAELYISISTTGCGPFRDLLNKLNKRSSAEVDFPPVSCVVSDGVISFSPEVAEELGLPNVVFWTISAFAFMCILHFPHLRERGYTPLKAEMIKLTIQTGTWRTPLIGGIDGIRLKHIPDTIWKTDAEDLYMKMAITGVLRTYKAFAIILNSFDALESKILKALFSLIDHVYPIGPVHLLLKVLSNKEDGIKSNLWKDDGGGCIEWLDSKEQRSVIYINYGSLTTLSQEHLVEFAWGLANSMQNFLWIIRPDLVARGSNLVLPEEFLAETKGRGKIASWCNQEEIISHPSIGGFLTHCGWNSTIEGLAAGVPMICWPFFADQPTNYLCLCSHWGVGMEINNDVKRAEVERVVRELMMGDKGKEMKNNALEWKRKAEKATRRGGSSYLNLDKLVEKVLLSPKNS